MAQRACRTWHGRPGHACHGRLARGRKRPTTQGQDGPAAHGQDAHATRQRAGATPCGHRSLKGPAEPPLRRKSFLTPAANAESAQFARTAETIQHFLACSMA